MGYDLHITRAENWCENEGQEISFAEWQAFVDHDPDLRPDPENDPHYVIWEGHPLDPAAQEGLGRLEAWLNWSDGNITTKNPDPPLLEKMIQIARLLDARVQGDEGEWYPDDTPATATRGRELPIRPVPAFVLSIIAVFGLAVVVALDAHVRRDYPVGTPTPITRALILAGLGGASVICGMLSCLFAIFSLVTRLPRAPFAWIALAIDAIAFGALLALR